LRIAGNIRTRTSALLAYSLTEVIVAVFVLSTIAIAFYGGLSSGFSATQSSREDLRATQIMMQKMEGLRLCTWSQLTNYTFQEVYDPFATNNLRGTLYSGVVSVGPATNVPANIGYRTNLATVTVTVFWTNYNPSAHSTLVQTRQMQTHIARYGLQTYIWGKL